MTEAASGTAGAGIRQARKGDGSGDRRSSSTSSGTRKQKRPKGQATAARESDAPAAEKADLDKKSEGSSSQGQGGREKAIEAAEIPDVDRPDLEPLAPEAMPRRGLARRRPDGTRKKTSGTSPTRQPSQ